MPEHGFSYSKKRYRVGLEKGQGQEGDNDDWVSLPRKGFRSKGKHRPVDTDVCKHGEDGGEKEELKSSSCPPLLCIPCQQLQQ